MDLLKVDGHAGLARDAQSGAIININKREAEAARERKKKKLEAKAKKRNARAAGQYPPKRSF